MPEIIDLPYCPCCGNRSFKSGSFKPWFCENCDFKLFPNVAAAAGVFIFDSENRVLFNQRAHNPGKGKLGLPGGFLDAGETAETAIIREVKEEVGLGVEDLVYLGSFPNQYFYGGILYHTIDLFYTARTIGKDVRLDPREVESVHWRHPASVREEEMAFPSYMQALERLLTCRAL